METGGASLQADYNLGYGTLTSITAWRFWNWNPYNDVDATSLDVLDNYAITDYQRQATQELRFTSPAGERFDFSAGAYYFYEDLPGTSRIAFGSDAGNFIVVPKLPLSLANLAMNGLNIYGNSDVMTNSAAAYSQATYHVTPQFDITAGLRYTYDTKEGGFGEYQFAQTPLSDISPGLRPIIATVRDIFGLPYANRDNHTYDTALSGTAIASYKLTPTMFLYASYSRGDKGAGINTLNLPSGVSAIVKPERVDAYEIGTKTSFLDNHIIVNADAFWSEDHNYQGVNIAPLNPNLYATYIANVPQVRTRGFELDTHAILAPGLIANFSGAYTDAINTKFPNAPCPIEVAGPNDERCNLTGSAVAGISRWTMSAGADYAHPIGNVGGTDLVGYGGADYSLRSAYNVSPTNSAYSIIPGYGILDLRLGIRTADSRYDLSLYANNALNTFYLVGAGAAVPITGLIVDLPGDPALYGIRFHAHF
jgi:iron complex outermembrane receptor protein